MIAVLAATYEEAERYAAKEQLGKKDRDWRAIVYTRDTRGLRPDKVITTPGAYRNPVFKWLAMELAVLASQECQ